MVIFLRNQQLPRLLSTLQNTRKANIQGEIISKLRSVITDYDFIVDRWPDYRALVVHVNPVTAKFQKHLDLASSVYAKDSDALESLLQVPHVIDWTSRVGFIGVYPYEMPAVVNSMQKHHRKHHMALYFDMKVTEKTLKSCPVPYGFKMRSLVPDQAHLVNSMWPHNDGIHSEPYIKELIRKQPSCCLYNREGSLVGYGLVYHYGYLGCLHVLKEHRSKGYAQVATSHLAALCLQQMEEVHVHVLEGNTASFAIRGEILSKLRSVITDYDFIVDRWPHYRALVVRASPVTAKYLNHLSLETLVYATDCDALGTLLQMPDIIDWTSRIGFGCVYPYEMSAVVSVMQKHLRKLQMELYFDMKVTEKTLKLRSIPDGFTMRSLIPEQAHLVSSMWPYSQGRHSASYIKELISKYPSRCMYNREGSLVGYALAYHYGYIGFLHVLKEHRRKGYGQVIISRLAGVCLQHMEEIHLHVQEANCASIALTKSIGFEPVHDQASCWWINKEASQ